MEFSSPAPANLTLESGTYYMDWAVTNDPAPFGYSIAEVEAQVAAVLGDPDGWERAGVVARHNASSPKVVFSVVEQLEDADATTFFNDPVTVYLSHVALQRPGGYWTRGVNHEAGHAFFTATHEGAYGIMNDQGGVELDWPNAADIQTLIEWLNPPEPEPPDWYWFPGNLPHYITRWPISSGAETRITATVLEGAQGA